MKDATNYKDNYFYFYRNKNLSSVKSGYLTRVDLPIGTYCDKNCVFCNEGGVDANNKKQNNSLEENRKLLERENPNWVTLGHREPTMSPFFLDNLKLCKKNGVDTISVISAGYGFDNYDFCEEVLLNGLNEIRFSIHGHNSEIHDLITQKKGSFDIIKKGLYNLSILSHKYNFDIFIMLVICKQNQDYLLEILKFLREYGIARIAFSFVEIKGSVKLNKSLIVPKISNLIPKLEELFDYYESLNRHENETLNIENIPYCALSEKYHKYIGYRTIKKGERLLEKENKTNTIEIIDQYRDKEFLETCEKCIYRNLCEGIHKGYTELHGKSELNPLIKINKSIINYKDLIYTLNFIDNIIVDVNSVKNISELIKIIIIFAIKGYKTFFLHPYFLSDKHLLNLKKRYNLDYINLIKDIGIEKK